uniref:Uncharacterized protein n=1 Tax=Caenorhabditis japonica TaxID=281687 RepID=A0A8R1IT75_CAEJA
MGCVQQHQEHQKCPVLFANPSSTLLFYRLSRMALKCGSDVPDPLLVIHKKKLEWAGHIMQRNDGRWTRLVQEYYPIGEKRPVGKPRMRWSYSLKKISLFDGEDLKTHWSTIAKKERLGML